MDKQIKEIKEALPQRIIDRDYSNFCIDKWGVDK